MFAPLVITNPNIESFPIVGEGECKTHLYHQRSVISAEGENGEVGIGWVCIREDCLDSPPPDFVPHPYNLYRPIYN